MAKNKELFFTNSRRVPNTVFAAADGTNWKDILVPNAASTRWEMAIGASSAATQRVVYFRMNNLNTGVIGNLGFVNIPAGAGTNGSVNVVSLLNSINLPWLLKDSDGNPYSEWNYNMVIQAKLGSAVTGSETIEITLSGGDYDAEV